MTTDERHVINALLDTLSAVLHNDWEYTTAQLDCRPFPSVLAPTGTFLAPAVEDESNNWGNRGAFLAAWRTACTLMQWDPANAHARRATGAGTGAGPVTRKEQHDVYPER